MTNQQTDKTDNSRLRRLAENIRTLNSALVTFEGPDDLYDRLNQTIEALTKELTSHSKLTRTYDKQILLNEDQSIREIRYGNQQDLSPVSGMANPIAPYLKATYLGQDRIEGTVNFSSSYEGGPGLVHGGFIAAVFDELLGKLQSYLERPGLTGKLTVRFIKPCPVNTEYRVEGAVTKISGRKISTEACMLLNGEQMATASALFISLT